MKKCRNFRTAIYIKYICVEQTKQTKQIKNYSPRRAKIPFLFKPRSIIPSRFPFITRLLARKAHVVHDKIFERSKKTGSIDTNRACSAATIGTIIADLLGRQIWLIIAKHRRDNFCSRCYGTFASAFKPSAVRVPKSAMARNSQSRIAAAIRRFLSST